MKIVKSILEMQTLRTEYRKAKKTIGLVPTMGALHDGHISLVNIAKKHCDVSVMSVFVNPIQFGPTEDFQKYPRPFDADCEKANTAGCDVVFAPSQSDMYPAHYNTFVDVTNITETLCGASRPGHFRGVATVVLKFFTIICPDIALFGQKDAQQVAVIKRMVLDLNVPVKVIAAPIIREASGLAMSSRNSYLTSSEREQAALIYKALSSARCLFETGERRALALKKSIEAVFESATLFTSEYIEISHTITLQPLNVLDGPALVAVAVRTKESKTRLIDNIILGGTL